MGATDLKEAVKDKYGAGRIASEDRGNAYCGASPATGKATIELG